MRNLLVLIIATFHLGGCGFGNFVNKCINDPPSSPARGPARDGEGKEVKMWVPKHASVNATWEFQARGEEDRCSTGYYLGKNIKELLPSKREIYKVLPNYGNRIWAYYYYYGEDIPGFDTTWHETVFNLYADANGRIYGCTYAKYSFGYVSKHGTSDGIEMP